MDDFEFPKHPFPKPTQEDMVFLFSGRYLYVRPDASPIFRKDLPVKWQDYGVHYCGKLKGHPIFSGECPVNPEEFLEGSADPKEVLDPHWTDLRAWFSQVGQDLASAAGRGSLVRIFHINHRYCGRCGQETRVSETDTSRICDRCNHIYYPRLSPAVIVLITRGKEVLLGHNQKSPPERFSLFAGFVEAGESCEQAAVREIREECGVEVKNLQFHSSQSWPFPDALMMGFTAEYAGGDPRPDGDEISEVRWFSPESPPLAFKPGSIAKKILDDHWKREPL